MRTNAFERRMYMLMAFFFLLEVLNVSLAWQRAFLRLSDTSHYYCIDFLILGEYIPP